MTTAVLQYPPELLFIICAHVYASGLPAANTSLDPVTVAHCGAPTGLPSSWPAETWSEPTVRRTLANLCLVNHAWYEAAKPWLWRKIEVRLPRSWLSLVDEIAGGDAEDEQDEFAEEKVALDVQQSISAAARAALASGALLAGSSGSADGDDAEAAAEKLRVSILETLNGPDGSIPPELLTPPASRDPSPRRPRAKSKSPARWKIMRSISDAVQNVMERSEYGLYVPRIDDPRPGRFVQHVDFNHFRTIGMRRSIEEGVSKRFVTGNRVEAVLKEMPNLVSFGATEYMDGSLTLPVLKELFLRGAMSRGRGRASRGRIMFDPYDPEEEDWERRRECKQLEAIDLTGCVSAVFVGALTEFVSTYLLPQDDESSSNEDEAGRRDGRRSRAVRFTPDEPLTFPGLQRLGLRGVKSINSHILTPFVLAFPSLTHLDLSATRVTPELLTALGDSSVRLKSLALARCIRLTGESIRSFLIESPVAARIEELSLYGDRTFPSPLNENDLREILEFAPCFTSGKLTYLDLSSSPVTKELLCAVCRPQPALRSLGLSYIPDLELHAVADFLKGKAPNVEVVTLVSTTPELEWGRAGAGMGAPRSSARQASLALHAQFIRPLCTPPFTFSLSSGSSGENTPAPLPPTRLRVIELSVPALSGLGAGAGSWRIVRSKGGRGWYVDTASAWVGGILRRDLPADHPHREEMERLAAANGNVSSGTGWHARKMEVLHGHGMLGREDGLYGAVSFAYQG